MLKRNGENCEHQVPNYPGLLTTSEHAAYQAAIPLVAEQVRLHNERTKVLADIENHCSEIAKRVAEQKNGPSADTWQVQHSLFKTSRGEMTFCSRGAGEILEFGVIEHFDPNSAYARAQGSSEEILRGNNAYLVLQ